MEFYKKTKEEDIEKVFEDIDKNKKNIFLYLKNSGLEIAEIMKKDAEEWENDFYKNTFIVK